MLSSDTLLHEMLLRSGDWSVSCVMSVDNERAPHVAKSNTPDMHALPRHCGAREEDTCCHTPLPISPGNRSCG